LSADDQVKNIPYRPEDTFPGFRQIAAHCLALVGV
jgi:hypothetical protein